MFAVRTYLDKSNVDLDGRSITILGVGGVANLPEYARMASELHIPWCAITDEDVQPGGTVKQTTKGVRDKLGKERRAADTLVEGPGCLETALGMAGGKAKPDWQRQNVEPKSLKDLKKDMPQFAGAAEKVKAWIEGQLPPAPTKP